MPNAAMTPQSQALTPFGLECRGAAMDGSLVGSCGAGFSETSHSTPIFEVGREIDFKKRGPGSPWRRRTVLGAAGAMALPGRSWSNATQPLSLRVASFPDLDRGVKVARARFEQRHPQVRVHLTTLGILDHHTAMTTALATGANVPDVMAIDVDYIGRLSRSAGLNDLAAAPFGAASAQQRLAAYAMVAAQPRPGVQAALPVDIGPGTLFYRTDLLQRAGLTEADLTASWPGFIEAGRRVKQTTGAYLVAHALDLADIGIRGGLSAGEGVYFDGAGKPLVRTPRFERAFERARAARVAGIDGRMRAWTNEWSEGLRSGRVATQMMGAWLAGHLKNWLAPDAAGLWRAAQLPEGAFAAWGGSYYAIPRTARQPELAWEFVQLLTLDATQQLAAFKDLDAFPALLEAQANAVMDEPLSYLGGQPARQLWRTAAARIAPTASDRYDPIAALVVQAELMKVLDQDKPVRLALADAHDTLLRRVRRR